MIYRIFRKRESKQNHPKDYYALVNRNYPHVITRGDSYRQLVKRAMNEIWEIMRKHQGERIAVFSHTGAICFMTLHLMGAIRRDTKADPVADHLKLRHKPLRDPRPQQHPRPRR